MSRTDGIRDRVVVITGGSAGVGRAAAQRFAARGARVALLARGRGGLDAAVHDVEAAGATALGLVVDVADAAAVEEAASRVERELGPIDVWVNAAFGCVIDPFLEITPEEYERVTRVAYLGCVNGTRAALRRMRQRDRGAVVQVGSVVAYRGVPLQSAYCGAKHAVQGFTESLRCELFHDRSGVRITMVQLAAINTPLYDWVLSRMPHRVQPFRPIYQPEVAADALVYAAGHPRRREYWVGGSTVATLLANAVVPGLLDRCLGLAGYAFQQTDESRPPTARSNLWEPLDDAPGVDFGAHGSFDRSSRDRSRHMWVSQHHGTLAALTAALLAVLAWVGRGRVRQP